MLQSRVKRVTTDGIALSDRSGQCTWLDAATVIWAVGVEGAIAQFPVPLTKKQRKIRVLPTLQIANCPEVFATGV